MRGDGQQGNGAEEGDNDEDDGAAQEKLAKKKGGGRLAQRRRPLGCTSTTFSGPKEETRTSWNYEEVVVGSNLHLTTNSENVQTNYLQ